MKESVKALRSFDMIIASAIIGISLIIYGFVSRGYRYQYNDFFHYHPMGKGA